VVVCSAGVHGRCSSRTVPGNPGRAHHHQAGGNVAPVALRASWLRADEKLRPILDHAVAVGV